MQVVVHVARHPACGGHHLLLRDPVSHRVVHQPPPQSFSGACPWGCLSAQARLCPFPHDELLTALHYSLQTDGKAARNLVKLQLFQQFYVLGKLFCTQTFSLREYLYSARQHADKSTSLQLYPMCTLRGLWYTCFALP